jgi:hypothetical protein
MGRHLAVQGTRLTVIIIARAMIVPARGVGDACSIEKSPLLHQLLVLYQDRIPGSGVLDTLLSRDRASDRDRQHSVDHE